MTWKLITDPNDLPDADTTVLICAPDADEPVWLGYHDGEVWRFADGMSVPNEVVAWMDLPEPVAVPSSEPVRYRVSEFLVGDVININSYLYRVGKTGRNGVRKLTPLDGGRLDELNAINNWGVLHARGGKQA